ncbi:GntR family transcriptional regulator [Govanella unica]|uniref:GntR family transcriptional regulator n=1 Tax=Govanella unica TaxID=2975056 RepID=A0A9X3TWB0_9PROT|nr:GntR family transcriptional regulator [Govania unica]MDA5192882.1 GntR family transcriptional regulator [Govania unica]
MVSKKTSGSGIPPTAKIQADKAVGRRDLAARDRSSLPIYHQLYTILRQQIIDGAYAEDVPLPTEMALSGNFNVSRVTVRRALDMLEREGMVMRRQGIGTFAVPVDESTSSNRLSGLIENLITLGIETSAEVLAFDPKSPVPPLVANTLKIPKSGRCLSLMRLRRHKGKPVSLTTVYLPESFGEIITKKTLDDRPIVRILELAGIIAANAEQTISAIAADEQVAARLDVSTGSPVIRLRRTVFDYDGKPILYQQSLYNPDRYEYYMLLSRDNSTARPQWRHLG